MPRKRTPVLGPRPKRAKAAGLTPPPPLAAVPTPSSAIDRENEAEFSPIENARPTPRIDKPVSEIEAATGERVVVAKETLAEKAELLIAPIEILAEEAVSVGGIKRRGPHAFGTDTVDEIGGNAGAFVAGNSAEVRVSNGEGIVAVKRVVKKTVKRVVKKLVKKKVPQKVVQGLVGCQNKESEMQNLVESDGESKSLLTLPQCVARNSDFVVSALVEVQNPALSMAIPISEAGNPGSCNAVEVEKENAAEFPVEAQNVGDVAEMADSADATLDSLDVVPTEVENSNNSDAIGGEKGTLVTKDSAKDQNAGEETVRFESSAEFLVEAGNMGSADDMNCECVTENVESGCAENARVCEDVGKPDQGRLQWEDEKGTGGVNLSGEMEALVRRRRRKTEIFVGGLEKEAKEEDVREVFEKVGEVVEVRMLMKGNTGKNKGYAFVRYASADDAEQALEEYRKVQICGKQCITAPVEGYDTLFIGNIEKKWKNEDVIKLLIEIGIEKLDKTTVMPDPTNLGCNRGFAFLEFFTSRDAQNAFKKLQNKVVLGKFHNIKVSWAEPSIKPDEEEIVKVKSVYAESLPSSWDEEKIKLHFKKYGEIENVVLARSLHSPRRKDFAFINYTTHEAAVACIKSFNNEALSDEGSKVNVKVSLAKPILKSRPTTRPLITVCTKKSKEKLKAIQYSQSPNYSRNDGVYMGSNLGDGRSDRSSSTNAELVQLLKEHATFRDSQRIFGRVPSSVDHLYSLPERKRPYSALGSEPLYPDHRGYPRLCMERSYSITSPSTLCLGVGLTSRTYYDQQGAAYTSGYGHTSYSNRFQREEAPYHENSDVQHYRHYRN